MDKEKDSKSSGNNSDSTNDQDFVDLEVEENNKEDKIIEISESEYLKLKEEIKKYKELADENLNKLKRAQADFDNYKKILDKQKIEYLNYAEKGILLKILDIIDEYEIALNALKKQFGEGKKIEGIEIIYNKFIEMLQKEGVKPIKSVGESFDPFIHECLLNEITDECPEDTVLEEIKKGYYFKDKVLRPALVKIAKNKERK